MNRAEIIQDTPEDIIAGAEGNPDTLISPLGWKIHRSHADEMKSDTLYNTPMFISLAMKLAEQKKRLI